MTKWLLLDSYCWRKQWHPTSVLLHGKSHGWRSLVGCGPWGPKSWTLLSNFTITFHFYALEKEMVTHSSVLAWRIPGTGEPDALPSMGLHRIGHDWCNLAAAAAVIVNWCISWLLTLESKYTFDVLSRALGRSGWANVQGGHEKGKNTCKL